MYNKVQCAQRKHLMLKSCIYGGDSWVGVKICYKIISLKSLSNNYMIGYITILM